MDRYLLLHLKITEICQYCSLYTDCSVSISPKMMVICDRRPVQMSVSEVLRRNVEKLKGYLKRELELELERQYELRHAKTLAQIFFENRIYKRIEECKTQEEEYKEVLDGLAPFRDQLRRDVTNDDVDKLLALPVRRIARFDIEKNQQELREIAAKIKEIKHNLAHLVDYAVSYLAEIKKKYGSQFPRRTEIEHFEEIDRHEAALNNIKIGWDRKNGYIGKAVKSEDTVVCNEFDRFLCVEKTGKYKVIPLPPDKLFVGKLYDFRRYDAQTVFGIVYREKKSGKFYGKRSAVGGFILEKEYSFFPAGCAMELFTPRADAIYEMQETNARGKTETSELNLMELPLRSAKARGVLISSKNVTKLTHSRYLTPEELEQYKQEEPGNDDNDEGGDGGEAPEVPAPETPAPVETPPAAAAEPPAPKVEEPPPTVEEHAPVEEPAPAVEEPAPAEEPPAPVEKLVAEKKAKKTKKTRRAKETEPEELEQPVEEPTTIEEPAPVAEEPAPVAEEPVTAEESVPAEEPVPVAKEPAPVEEPAPAEEPAPSVEEPAPVAEEPPPSPAAEEVEPLKLTDEETPNPPKHRAPHKKAAPPPEEKKPELSAKDDPDDELGIVQPEFGF